MAVLDESALAPRIDLNGASKTNGNYTNGFTKANGDITNGISKIVGANNTNGTTDHLPVARQSAFSSRTLPSFVPPKSLIQPKTVGQIAHTFDFTNITNKHHFHQHEFESIRAEKLEIKSDEYMTNILNLKVVQDEKYLKYISYRTKIAHHLQEALHDSDEVLQALSELTEKASIAEHRQKLAEEARNAAEKVRQQLKEELEKVNCELSRSRFRLIELVRERDGETVKAQNALNQLTIRDEQIEALELSITGLQKTVGKLTKEHADAMDGWLQAQKDERLARQQAEQWYTEVQSLEKQKKLLDENLIKLSDAFEKVQHELTVTKTDLANANSIKERYEKENSRLEIALSSAKDSLKTAEDAERRAALLRDEATRNYREAVDAEQEAKRQRDEAEAARNSAEDSAMEAMRQYKDNQARLEDTKYLLEKETREKHVLKDQRNHAIERASVACHYTQQCIEWGQALNLINHQLFQQFEIMQTEKIKAIEEKMYEERQRKVLQGETVHAHQTMEMLETEREQLLEERRLAKVDIETINSQFTETRGDLESKLGTMEEEIAGLRVEQLGWEGERSQYLQSINDKKSAYEEVVSKKKELEKKLAESHVADEQLRRDHEAAIQKLTIAEQDLKIELEKEIQQRDEDEKALREKHVADVLEHQYKEKRLQDQIEAEIRKRENDEKLLEEKLNAQREEFKIIEQELRNNYAESQKDMKATLDLELKKGYDSVKRGHSYEHVWIQDVFLGNERLDESKENNKEIYNKIGHHFGSSEPLQLGHFFPDKKDKKKQVVVVYINEKNKLPRVITAFAEGALQFNKA